MKRLQSLCANCGTVASFFEKEKYPLVKFCNTCGAWLCNMDSELNLTEIYSEKYFNGEEYTNYQSSEKIHKKNFVRKIKMLKSAGLLFDSNTRVLEIGCASGIFLDVLKAAGYKNIMGVEVSDYAREIAQKKGHKVYSPFDPEFAKIASAFNPQLLCAWDVWEHLENPAQVFKDLISFGDSSLGVAVTTVDSGQFSPKLRGVKWRQFHPPSHLNYPTRKSFELFFETNKMKIVRHKSFGMYRPLADYIVAVIKPFKKIIKPGSFLYSIPMYLNLFDIQIVVAKK